jgi:hypothetical protein
MPGVTKKMQLLAYIVSKLNKMATYPSWWSSSREGGVDPSSYSMLPERVIEEEILAMQVVAKDKGW